MCRNSNLVVSYAPLTLTLRFHVSLEERHFKIYELIAVNSCSAAEPRFIGKSTKSCKSCANIAEHFHDANNVFKDSK